MMRWWMRWLDEIIFSLSISIIYSFQPSYLLYIIVKLNIKELEGIYIFWKRKKERKEMVVDEIKNNFMSSLSQLTIISLICLTIYHVIRSKHGNLSHSQLTSHCLGWLMVEEMGWLMKWDGWWDDKNH